jgi:hypothetical protein
VGPDLDLDLADPGRRREEQDLGRDRAHLGLGLDQDLGPEDLAHLDRPRR